MTNMSVSGRTAITIRNRLRSLGVVHAHIFGKEFFTKVIRKNARLRAMMPRVYGLGDLSLILDERAAAQTKALLGHMIPTLKVYVPTKPHVDAIRTLAAHGIVLLLGNPATGKSTIAAILATIRSENPDRIVLKADGPNDLFEHWNPNEPQGFYWIDDAFGPNQMREDFVDQWIAGMPKLQAAVAAGNQFVLTSRRHIYEEAKPKLGSRNYPDFKDERAIVDVGNLTPEEKKQILYNHVRAGNQSTRWKQQVKPHLDAIASEWSFLPEIARRLSDPVYTSRLSLTRESLIRFVKEPKEHLLQTIRELSKAHRAALTLVFLHRSLMPVGTPVASLLELLGTHFAVDSETLGQSLSQLKDSFLIQRTEGDVLVWTFKHPTIADAIGTILGETSGMSELYLRGSKLSSILAETTCIGAVVSRDAVIISEAQEPFLVERILEVPDEPNMNRALFAFLAYRASDRVLKAIVDAAPETLNRKSSRSYRISMDSKIKARARAHRLGLLTSDQRLETALELENAVLSDVDTSVLEDEGVLAIFTGTELLRLPAKIKNTVLDEFPEVIENISENADVDSDADSLFEDLESSLATIQEIFENDASVEDAVSGALEFIEEQKEKHLKRQRDARSEPDEDWDWNEYVNDHKASASPPISREVMRTITDRGSLARDPFSATWIAELTSMKFGIQPRQLERLGASMATTRSMISFARLL